VAAVQAMIRKLGLERMLQGGTGVDKRVRNLIEAMVYGWFTEGFDTVDLKETKALLDELQT
jgi:hypothetical protein